MKCCGQEHITPFCPLCGKSLGESAIFQLLQHCRTTRDNQLSRVTGAKEGQIEDSQKEVAKDRHPEYWRKSVEKNQRLFDKWDAWVKALESLALPAGSEPT